MLPHNVCFVCVLFLLVAIAIPVCFIQETLCAFQGRYISVRQCQEPCFVLFWKTAMKPLKPQASNENLEIGMLWYFWSLCMVVFFMSCLMRCPKHPFFSQGKKSGGLLANC